MSSNSRIMRSKGESDGLSLPVRTRQRKKSINMENDRNTSLKSTFDTGLDQQHPQMPVHTFSLPTQPPRPTSTQSITGPMAGNRQPPGQHLWQITQEIDANPHHLRLMQSGCRKPQYQQYPPHHRDH